MCEAHWKLEVTPQKKERLETEEQSGHSSRERGEQSADWLAVCWGMCTLCQHVSLTKLCMWVSALTSILCTISFTSTLLQSIMQSVRALLREAKKCGVKEEKQDLKWVCALQLVTVIKYQQSENAPERMNKLSFFHIIRLDFAQNILEAKYVAGMFNNAGDMFYSWSSCTVQHRFHTELQLFFVMHQSLLYLRSHSHFQLLLLFLGQRRRRGGGAHEGSQEVAFLFTVISASVLS